MSRTIAIVTHDEMEGGDVMLAALQEQLTRDVEPVWHLPPTELVLTEWANAPRNAWALHITHEYDLLGMGAFETNEGQPRALLWTEAIPPGRLSVYVSAALIAMVVDPRIRLVDHSGGLLLAREPVPPVWGLSYGVDAPGAVVQVADFVYPAWFDVPHPSMIYNTGPFDHCHGLRAPRDILPPSGSFLAWTASGWFQVRPNWTRDEGWTQEAHTLDFDEPVGMPKRVARRLEQGDGRPPE